MTTTTDFPTPEQVDRLMALHETLGNRPARYRSQIIDAVMRSGMFTAEKIETEIARLVVLRDRHAR